MKYLLFSSLLFICFLSPLHAQTDDSRAAEKEFLLDVVPGLKRLDRFLNRQSTDATDNRIVDTPSSVQQNPSGTFEEIGAPTYTEADLKRMQMETQERIVIARRQQQALLDDADIRVRGFVVGALDKCKAAIAASNEEEARANCASAELRIQQCESEIAPRINSIAERQTLRFAGNGPEGNLRGMKLDCGRLLRGLESPHLLLQAAKFRLIEYSCDGHLTRLRESMQTGILDNRLGDSDKSPQAYAAWIKKMCMPAQAAIAQKLLETAPPAPPSDTALRAFPDVTAPPAPPGAVALSRKSGGAKVFEDAKTEAPEPNGAATTEANSSSDLGLQILGAVLQGAVQIQLNKQARAAADAARALNNQRRSGSASTAAGSSGQSSNSGCLNQLASSQPECSPRSSIDSRRSGVRTAN